jgi:hypothetical protein
MEENDPLLITIGSMVILFQSISLKYKRGPTSLKIVPLIGVADRRCDISVYQKGMRRLTQGGLRLCGLEAKIHGIQLFICVVPHAVLVWPTQETLYNKRTMKIKSSNRRSMALIAKDHGHQIF